MNPFKVVAKVGKKMTKPAAKALAKVSKKKPEIFVGAGLLMVVGSFVWVVAEAMKAPEAMTESSDKVKAVEDKFAAIREEDETRTEAECKVLAIRQDGWRAGNDQAVRRTYSVAFARMWADRARASPASDKKRRAGGHPQEHRADVPVL